MPSPFFSIVIPSYNRAKHLPHTLKSIFEQTFQDFEIIVVDDASTDNTEAVVQSYPDPRLIYLRNNTNMERCAARNRGIEVCHGKYICFLDSDDYYLPSHLSELQNAVVSSGEKIALFFTNAFVQSEEGALTERFVPAFDSENPFAYILVYTFNPVRTCIHRTILEKYHFDPKITGIEDMDLCLRIAIQFPIIHIQKYTCVYVSHSESYTKGNPEKIYQDFRNYKIVFAKPELKNFLPTREKNRLLSMSHYFIALDKAVHALRWQVIYHAVVSFFLYPPGYNNRTNKVLLIAIIYNIPVIGFIAKKVRYILTKATS